MRPSDLLAFALSGLARHPLRTLLTVLAVVIGSATLLISVSVGQGVERAIVEQWRRSNRLRQFNVNARYTGDEASIPPDDLKIKGPMSDAKRARLRKAAAARWGRTHLAKPTNITPDRLAKIRTLPHVVNITPLLQLDGQAFLNDQPRDVSIAAASSDDETLDALLVAGTPLPDGTKRVALVHEHLLYTWGIISDEDVKSILGKSLRLEYQVGGQGASRMLILVTGGAFNLAPNEYATLDRAFRKLPASLEATSLNAEEQNVLRKALAHLTPQRKPAPSARYIEDFTITGIIRQRSEDDPQSMNDAANDADVILPSQAAEEFNLRAARNAEEGFHSAFVLVDSEDEVESVSKAIKSMGLNTYTLLTFIAEVRRNVRLITFGVSMAAVAALFVASLGIANTMVMAVLERTREVGVLKAIGARDRDIQRLFLCEGALIGLLGGALGVLLGWLAQFPGDAIAKSFMIDTNAKTHFAPLSVFLYPPWLLLGVPALAIIIATLAAISPARRAARMSPVDSLRHE